MSSWTAIIVAFSAGLGLGLLFFGGLWLTIRKLPSSSRPRVLFWSSFLIRNVVTVALFILLCQTDWLKWAATLAGFLTIRTALLYKQTPHTRLSL